MAEMNIEYPNISDQTPEGQLRQVKDYLFLLADKLNLQDNSAEKVFQEVSKAIDAEAVATTDNEQAAKLREYANLKALIVKTGEYAITHSEEISKVFNSSFGANSDFGKYYEELERRVTENAQGVEDLFTYTAGINNENGNFGVGTKQFIKSGLLYYDENQIPVFGVGVGVLSTVATDGDEVIDLKQNRLATFAADEIAFWDNGNKVAYISGNAINFPAANIRGGSIHIGEEEHNFFKVDTAGNLKVGDYFSVDSSGIASFQSANGKMALDLSAGVITAQGEYATTVIGDEGIVFKSKNNILGMIDTVDHFGDLTLLSSSAQLGSFVVWSSGKIYGTFNRQGIKSSDIGLVDKEDMETEYAKLTFNNDSGALVLRNHNAYNWLSAYIDDDAASLLEMGAADGTTGKGVSIAVSAGGNGQIAVMSKGSVKGGIIASANGGYLRLGGSSTDYDIAWNSRGTSYVQADHFHFKGATDGLITGGVPADECSAYIVIGQPTRGGYYSSVTIPSDIATGRTWQIADENCYVTFTISSDGTVEQTGSGKAEGSSATPGSITDSYSIR